jgi:hypothetical protein
MRFGGVKRLRMHSSLAADLHVYAPAPKSLANVSWFGPSMTVDHHHAEALKSPRMSVNNREQSE